MNGTAGTEIVEYVKAEETVRTVGGRLGNSAQPELGEGPSEKRQSPVTVRQSTNTMTLERWEQISRLFYAALEVDEPGRANFLEDACFGDADLLGEVKSLLAVDDQPVGPLGQHSMDKAEQPLRDDTGSLLGCHLGPYRVVSLLGVGGMGEVYKAVDTRLERVVALKILPEHLTSAADRLKRFHQEALTIAALNHPNICMLYDMGEYRGRSFLVMEYLAGESLAEHLKKGPLPLEQALEAGTEVADALEAAHKRGIVHRDLKPGNVMLTKTGAKLIDFGLAKLKRQETPNPLTAETVTETTPGMVMGTLEYMSPEQLEGRPVDARTDLWGLGVMLYEMLTGKRAFEGPSRARVIAAILEHEPAPFTVLQQPIPPLLDCLLQRCLTKNPDDRWASAHDVAGQLRTIRRGLRAVSHISETVPHLAKLRWAAIGLLMVVALMLNVGAGL